MIKRFEVKDGGLIVLNGEFANVEFFGCVGYIRQEFAVGAWTIGAEFVQDFGKGCIWHGDLEKVV